MQFAKSLDKWYYRRAERVFLLLVFIDALVTAFKHTNMNEDLALALQIWQVVILYLYCRQTYLCTHKRILLLGL